MLVTHSCHSIWHIGIDSMLSQTSNSKNQRIRGTTRLVINVSNINRMDIISNLLGQPIEENTMMFLSFWGW